MRTTFSVMLALLFVSCTTPARVERAEGRVGSLTTGVDVLMTRVRALGGERERAAAAYHRIRQTYAEASGVALEAAIRFREADSRWRLAQWVIVAAAMLDVHLAQARAASIPIDCADGMSVSAFRRYLTSLGYEIAGLPIDHIVPLKEGGANHPANYRVTTTADNASWGGHWGADKCRFVGASRCAAAVKASQLCGSFGGRMPAL